MSYSYRVFFIDDEEKLTKFSISRFEKICELESEELFPEYKNSRIRYAMAVVELQNRKPVSIARIDCGYLVFDAEGKVDQDFELAKQTKLMEAAAHIFSASADHKPAKNQDEDEFTWELTSGIAQKLSDAIIK